MADDDDEIHIHITIEWEEDDDDYYEPSMLDVAAHNAVSTIHNYVLGFIFLIPLGWLISFF